MSTDEENQHFPFAVKKLSQVSPTLTLIQLATLYVARATTCFVASL